MTTTRPNRRDPKVVTAAADKLAQIIIKDWDKGGDHASWKDSLARIIGRNHDAYHVARDLEADGACPDIDLVNLLSRNLYRLEDIHASYVAEWVKQNNIRPSHAVGDTVTTVHGTGQITRIDEEQAQYVVNVRKGPDDNHSRGWLINYEDAHTINAAGG